jgi:hypothetical protein
VTSSSPTSRTVIAVAMPGAALVGAAQGVGGCGRWPPGRRRQSWRLRGRLLRRPRAERLDGDADATSPACAPPIRRRRRTAAPARTPRPRSPCAGARCRCG